MFLFFFTSSSFGDTNILSVWNSSSGTIRSLARQDDCSTKYTLLPALACSKALSRPAIEPPTINIFLPLTVELSSQPEGYIGENYPRHYVMQPAPFFSKPLYISTAEDLAAL